MEDIPIFQIIAAHDKLLRRSKHTSAFIYLYTRAHTHTHCGRKESHHTEFESERERERIFCWHSQVKILPLDYRLKATNAGIPFIRTVNRSFCAMCLWLVRVWACCVCLYWHTLVLQFLTVFYSASNKVINVIRPGLTGARFNHLDEKCGTFLMKRSINLQSFFYSIEKHLPNLFFEGIRCYSGAELVSATELLWLTWNYH